MSRLWPNLLFILTGLELMEEGTDRRLCVPSSRRVVSFRVAPPLQIYLFSLFIYIYYYCPLVSIRRVEKPYAVDAAHVRDPCFAGKHDGHDFAA